MVPENIIEVMQCTVTGSVHLSAFEYTFCVKVVIGHVHARMQMNPSLLEMTNCVDRAADLHLATPEKPHKRSQRAENTN